MSKDWKKASVLSLSAAGLLAIGPAVSAELLLWYDFEESGGTTVNDQSGNNRDLTLLGGNFGEVGVFGNGVRMGSALARTGGVSAGTITSLNGVTGNQLTIAFWANTDVESVGSNPFYISDSNNSPGDRFASAHLEWTDGNIYWDAAWDQSTSNRVAVAGGTVSDTYHHYVFTYDGDAGELFVYKDNALLSSNTTAPGGALDWAGMQNFELGALSFVNGNWSGLMDDFAMWNEVLDANQRTDIFTNGVPEPGSLALLAAGGLLVLRRRR